MNFAGSKGTLVISAAGNDGLDLGQSQDITSVPAESGSGLAISRHRPSSTSPMSVGAPDGGPRTPASYSNFGEGTTYVAAPGGRARNHGPGSWSTHRPPLRVSKAAAVCSLRPAAGR